ncbi:hypothetical protein ACFQPF_08495 [Fictibacillus iocasae]|uniref:Uncharacterized protein n=1 Tax=Fictibacillus iocasae TaxID=2715437 RepID=A0ABW2NQZ2_9BACL
MKLILTGGKEREGLQSEVTQYEQGVILTFDTTTISSVKNVEYTSLQGTCPHYNPSILFKAGTIKGEKLYLCTQTEVLIYSLPGFQQLKHLSLKCFNDLHHVTPTDAGTLLVANTGLDMVMELTENGEILKEWDVLGESTWQKYSTREDYRLIRSTKPHRSHPNYVFTIGNHYWVTRCHQQDAVCLTHPGWKMPVDGSYIHDGVIHKGSIYFTRVDGYIVRLNLQNLARRQMFDLNEISGAEIPLGWCRGIKAVGDNKVVVGFSRLRPTTKINPDGTKTSIGNFGVKPTHIACFDLVKKEKLWEYNMEEHGMNAIYSIL